MTTDEIQQIINYAYPKIQKYYGKGKLDYPVIDTSHKNTYALHSGEPEATGEHAATSINELTFNKINNNKMYDLLGRELTEIPVGTMYIRNNKLYITK